MLTSSLLSGDRQIDIRVDLILRGVRYFRAIGLAFTLFYVIGGLSMPVNAQKAGYRGSRDRPEIAASPQSSVTVTATNANEPVNSTFTVATTVNDVTGLKISSFQFNIIYNPLVIAPTGNSDNNFACTSGALSSAAAIGVTCNVQSIDVTHSKLLVAAFGTGTLSGMGSILNVQFAANPTATSGTFSPLTFENLYVFNNLGLVPTAPPVNGQITLAGPTAGGASVGGMLMSGSGQAIGGALITMTDSFGSSRIALSNPFGFYRFDEVQAGSTYVISVQSKGHTFQPITVSVNESLTGINLIADQ